MHIMPWFVAPSCWGGGDWGFHWKMNNKNPNNWVSQYKREIAAHDYPAQGPYCSGDDYNIQYQQLLMKYAGVDGVAIDWYGTTNFSDFPRNKEMSDRIAYWTTKTGLKLTVVYEDWTTQNGGSALNDMNWLQGNWFQWGNYVKVNNQPLLMVF